MTADSYRHPVHVTHGSAEPVIETWAEVDGLALLRHLDLLDRSEPAVLAINGRSGAGKSTLARRLATVVPGAVCVATDDIAWHYSMFDWSAEIITQVIEPVRRGESVHYRPPGWVLKDRPGAVTIEADRCLLIVEGVGSSQHGLTDAIDAAIWVQSDAEVARKLGIERDVASGENGNRAESIAVWDEWAAAEQPFLEHDAPWSRSDVIVAGVPLVDSIRIGGTPAEASLLNLQLSSSTISR